MSDAGANAKKESTKKPKKTQIDQVIDGYLDRIMNIYETFDFVLPHVESWIKDERKLVNEQLKKFIPSDIKKGEKRPIEFESAASFSEFTSTLRRLDKVSGNRAPIVMSRSLFMQLFSEFDAYIGLLLKTIYTKNENLLKGVSREISLSDLLDFNTIESVKSALLEKEIDTFRRDSYIEQFNKLELKFKINLKKFDEWPSFVELSQRRNIFTHNGGIVNEQYLQTCKKEGYKFTDSPTIGSGLEVSKPYFTNAVYLVAKVGVMLGYTLWSKIFPAEHESIHSALNGTLYQCLENKRWSFVSNLSGFVLSENMKKSITEIEFRIRLINIAIGMKYSTPSCDPSKLLNAFDWSACYRDFKLAIAVLEERFSDATEIMQSIGKSGEIIQQADYHSWPLFEKFREKDEFYSTYEKIYGEPFSERQRKGGDAVGIISPPIKISGNENQ